MLQDVICASLSREEDLEVILEAGDEDGLLDAVSETRADAVVLNAQGGEVPEAAVKLLGEHPRLKIFAITPNGRDGFSLELRPRTHFLSELSAQDLVDEIRDAVNRDRQDPARSDR